MTPEQATAEVSALLERVRKLEQTQPLVDINETAKYLAVSVKTVRRWVKDGSIPYKRIGRVLRFNLSLLAPKCG